MSNKYSNRKQSQAKPGLDKQSSFSGVSDTILSTMFQKIRIETNLNLQSWNRLMNSYLADKKNGIRQNNRDISSARGNLTKELLKKKMTWKVFCKGLRFLNARRFTFILKVEWNNDKVSEHSISVRLTDNTDQMDNEPKQTQSELKEIKSNEHKRSRELAEHF